MTEQTSSVWVLPDDSAPLRHVVAEHRRRFGPTDVLFWQDQQEGLPSYGHIITLRRSRTGYPLTVKAISPRLAWDLARHPADVIVVLEIDLAALYAVLSRLLGRRRRRIIALIESDVAALGPTGTARWKMGFRRIVARWLDGFVANNHLATTYLTRTLGVPPTKVVEGWWLAGLPDDLVATTPPPAALRGDGPVFLAIGQLIPRKGHDLLLRAAARYTRQVGPCRVWIIGDGPDEDALRALAADLGLDEVVTFFGRVDHAALKGALEACDAFVFPTRGDLIGRALVETLSTGTPVVVSRRSGAIGTLLHDGDNAVVVDPEDPDELLRGLRVVTDPEGGGALRAGAEASRQRVSVQAAASVIHSGIDPRGSSPTVTGVSDSPGG